MEKDILDGKIGEIGAYDLEFKEGKLSFKLDLNAGGIVLASLSVAVPAKAVTKAIKAAIPGKVDDAIIGVVEAALLEG